MALRAVVKECIATPLRGVGFVGSGMNFHRRHGACVQVVNVQVSRLSTQQEKRFFVNVGLAFDDICRLARVPILEKPKEYHCDSRGTRDRLERLVVAADEEWIVSPGADASATTIRLHLVVAQLVSELESIDGPAAYRAHGWFDRFRPKQENAQVFYILGAYAEARQELEHLAVLFHDRKNASRVDWWVGHLGLAGIV